MSFPEVSERRSNKPELLAALEGFQPCEADRINGTCGNIQWQFDGSPELGSGLSVKGYKGGIFDGKAFYELVSAPYLLAKLVAGYPGLQVNAEGQEGYKVTWTVILKHKKTGHVVTFYDWKGAAAYGSDLRSEMPESFRRDLSALLKALASPYFPHPYDGCVIGEIA